MKKIILLLIVSLVYTGCMAQKSTDASKILKDEQKKEEIFSAILKDRELRAELMKRMMKEAESSGMMMNMMKTAENDTAACKMMSSMMMKDPHMMDMMMNSMMDKAENDDAMCRKMCMRMMESDKMKGMMQEMNGQEQSPRKTNGKGSSNMQKHLEEKHHSSGKNK